MEPADLERHCAGGVNTSSVIRLAGDAGCHLPLKGKAWARSWDGKLPTVMSGQGGSEMIPVLDVNQMLPQQNPADAE